MRDAEVGLPGRDQADRVPGFVLGQGDPQVRVRRQDGGQRGRDQAAHRGGERGQPHVPGDGPRLLVQPRLQLLQVGEEPAALLDQVPAVPGEHHAPADPLEQRHAGLLFQPLDLLRHRARGEAERVGRRVDRAVRADGAQRVERHQVNHEAMLHDLTARIFAGASSFAAVTLGGVNRRDTALAALVAALWGFNFVVIDWGMGTVPPLLFAAIRFTVVAVPACFLVPRPPVPFRTVAAVGAFMSLGQFGFLYLSMHLGMPPGLAALVLQAQVRVHHRDRRRRAARAADAGAGGRGVARRRRPCRGRARHRRQRRPLALALCLLAGPVVGDRQRRVPRVEGAGRAGAHRLVGDRGPGAAARPQPAHRRPRRRGPRTGAPGLARRAVHGYTAGLCSLVGYAVFNRLLSGYPSGKVVPWVLLAPVVAMASSWALLGEAPGPAELAGAALLVAGVLIAQGVIRLPRHGGTDQAPAQRGGADRTASGERRGEQLPAPGARRTRSRPGASTP